MRVPRATYRVQFSAGGERGAGFGFAEGAELVAYLDALGVSDLYASPVFRARPGSTHGYDVVDPTRLNPELGGEDAFLEMSDRLRERGMGLLLDIVPNHMAAAAENRWWWDVLANGRSSPFAAWFDVDWDGGAAGPGRVVLPVLGGRADDLVGSKELSLALEPERGFVVAYHAARWPVDVGTWDAVLAFVAERAGAVLVSDAEAASEWEGVRRQVGDVGGRDDAGGEDEARCDRAASARLRFDGMLRRWPELAALVQDACAAFDGLGSLLERQAYRLEYWREGAARINYRRFFDITDLIGVRVETPGVFEETHGLVRSLARQGRVAGVRVDHVDGLFDPAAYLAMLDDSVREPEGGRLYTVVEKILAPGERLPRDWRVAGSTGYDALNVLNRVFVDPAGLREIDRRARSLLALPESFDESAFAGKRLATERLFPADFGRLARELERVARDSGIDRESGASRAEINDALRLVTASMEVYRTYVRCEEISPEDRAQVEAAAASARARGATARATDAVRRVLLLDPPRGASGAAREACLRFVRRWQQVTGPVVAKGVEDTALYRHVTLASLNEVGGGPELFDDPVAALHAFNAHAAQERPHSMIATSTHDTKRSEDARARLGVLSEIAGEWTSRCERWACAPDPSGDGPTPRDRVLALQSLLAVWPLEWDAPPSLGSRLKAYLLKAAREAKERTSWTDSNATYEEAVRGLAGELLDGRDGGRFLASLLPLARRVAWHGALNSLSQTLLKLTSPGVPDIYQGCEMWDFSLVDPDNRRPVDFERRRSALEGIESEAGADRLGLCERLCASWTDGRVKLFLTWAALRARREHEALFSRGSYEPLAVSGPQRERVVAFARRREGEGGLAVVVVPRLTVGLVGERRRRGLSLEDANWAGTRVDLGCEADLVNAVTGERVGGSGAIEPAAVLRSFPVALLVGRVR